MSLFGPVYVTAVLTLSRRESDALQAVPRIAVALEAVVAKLDSASGLTSEQEQQVAELIARLKVSGDALGAAAAAQP